MIARDIARYVGSVRYSDLDKRTVDNAKRLIADTIGCGIGAFGELPVQIAMDTVRHMKGARAATILGTGIKVEPQMAAFVNGTMTRYFDYNDTYDAKEFSHPSDNIMPILAVSQAEGRSGKDALLGCIIAYEIQARLADAANLWKRGWDHVIYGLVSVSAAASRMMGLPDEKTEQAINIALNSHIVMRQLRAGELSMWKGVAFSNVARNAIFAAELARNGMTGPSPVFEGEMGLFKQVTGQFRLDTRNFGKGGGFRINRDLIKYFPAETRAQAAIFAALKLRKEISSVNQIGKVEIGAGEATVKVIGSGREKWNPMTKETADHSMPYIVAAALMDGKIDTATFMPRRFRDRKILEFMRRIVVREVPRYTAMFNRGGTVNAAAVGLQLRDGRFLQKEIIYPKGHWKNPMSDEEVKSKFRRLAGRYMDADRIEKALGMLWRLEQIEDVGRLFSVMRFR